MNGLVEALSRVVDGIGKPGIIGLGLLVFASSLAAAMVLPAYEALQAARAQYERIAQRMDATSSRRDGRKADIQTELATFMRHFPPADEARQDILRLQGFAANHGIQLRSGEYRLAPERGIELVRHQIAFPVTGPYQSIRAFIAEALAELPSAALESVSFKRDSVVAREIEARLQFALYTAGT
ncbi:MAG: hypothetical protein ACREUX_14855 [Burkholderiales bacterium]